MFTVSFCHGIDETKNGKNALNKLIDNELFIMYINYVNKLIISQLFYAVQNTYVRIVLLL